MDDDENEITFEEKRIRWLALGNKHPPEWLARYVASENAPVVVVTGGHGVGADVPSSAYLDAMDDVPFWAFALAKSYLDDVGEWPLVGMHAEYALLDYTEHKDPERALMEIITTIKRVWHDVEVVFVGEGRQ